MWYEWKSRARGSKDFLPKARSLLGQTSRFKQTFRLDGKVDLTAAGGCLAKSRRLKGPILGRRGARVGKGLRSQHVVDHGRHGIHLGGNGSVKLTLKIGKDDFRDEVAECHGCGSLLLFTEEVISWKSPEIMIVV